MKKLKPTFITAGFKEAGKWVLQTDESCCGIVAILNLYRWYNPRRKITNVLLKKIIDKTFFTYGGIYPEFLHNYFIEEEEFILADYKNRVDIDWIDKQLAKGRAIVLIYVTANGATSGHYTMITEKVDDMYTLLNNGGQEVECSTRSTDLIGWLAEEHTYVGCTVFAGGWAFSRKADFEND